mmetsp:Transcript_134323/g.268085  ORF Transcript_134323/g.268085 Transcript_134323/m.268085 type:complete len:217 (-) Transcript_134323:1090-1740(-)
MLQIVDICGRGDMPQIKPSPCCAGRLLALSDSVRTGRPLLMLPCAVQAGQRRGVPSRVAPRSFALHNGINMLSKTPPSSQSVSTFFGKAAVGTTSEAFALRNEVFSLHAAAVSTSFISVRPTGSLIRSPESSKISGCQTSLPAGHTKELSRFKYASRPWTLAGAIIRTLSLQELGKSTFARLPLNASRKREQSSSSRKFTKAYPKLRFPTVLSMGT